MESLHPHESTQEPLIDPMEKVDSVNSNVPPPQQNPINQSNTKPRKRRFFMGILFAFLAIVLLTVGSASAAYMIAYGKIDIKNPQLQREISMFIQDLPFTPKTPEYLITKTYSAQQTIDSAYLEASLAFSTQELTQYLGTSNIDLKVAGPLDFSNLKEPKFDFNLKINPEVDMDFRMINKKFFFRVNQIPGIIKGMIEGYGIIIDPFLNVWIYNEVPDFESDARALLDENSEISEQQAIDKTLAVLSRTGTFSKIKVLDTSLDGNPVYELTLSLTGIELADLMQEFDKEFNPDSYTPGQISSQENEIVQSTNIKLYIDKSDYFVRKTTFNTSIKMKPITESSVLGTSTIQNFPGKQFMPQPFSFNEDTIDLAFVSKISRINEKFEFTEPDDGKSIEQVVREYMEMMMGRPETQYSEEDYDGFSSPETYNSEGFSTSR